MPEKKKAPIPVPPWEPADAYALQAVEKGEASAEQQKRALAWIINVACQAYDFPDQPENERLSAIWLGRYFVGKQIVKLIKLNITKIKEAEEKAAKLRKEK